MGKGQVEIVPLDHTVFYLQGGELGVEFKRHGALPDARSATNEKNLTLHVHPLEYGSETMGRSITRVSISA